VKKDDGSSTVYNLEINEDGTFNSEWPGGFFPQRQSESLALARASMGIKRDEQEQLSFKYPEEL